MQKRKPVVQKHVALPLKTLSCPMCPYISMTGASDLQLHLDNEHKGWAERTIKKMDIRERE